MQLLSAAAIPSTSSGATTMPDPVSRISVGRRAVGRNDGEDRAAGGDVLVHLPRENALAASARLGDEQQQRLGVALNAERAHARGGSRRARGDLRGRASPPTRDRTSGSRRRTARPRRGPASWNACRNGRGSRLPKKLPVWVMRKRCAGPVLEARRSRRSRTRSRSTRTAPRAPSPRISSAIASETHVTASALTRDEPGDLLHRGLPRAGSCRVVTAVLVRDERVAKVGDPARAGRLLDGGADEVHRGWRRRRDHDVDPLAPHDADRGRDRREVPGDARVGEEQTPRGDLRLHERAIEPVRGGGAPRRASAPAGRGSARGGSTPVWARATRNRCAPTSGRPERARASRSPSAGRYCASLSERCTPPPPAGGKYIVTRSTFTAGKRRARPSGSDVFARSDL